MPATATLIRTPDAPLTGTMISVSMITADSSEHRLAQDSMQYRDQRNGPGPTTIPAALTGVAKDG